jgi:hypothetical protein
MHIIIYPLVIVCVTCFLVALPFFPFWKVWARLRSHHKDIWDSHGGFPPRAFLTDADKLAEFLRIVSLAERDVVLRERDPVLVRWTRAAVAVWRMVPGSLAGRVLSLAVLCYLVWALSHGIMDVFFG